ncbi:hypothetical protein KI387_021712, partial [Taxus chinensis]
IPLQTATNKKTKQKNRCGKAKNSGRKARQNTQKRSSIGRQGSGGDGVGGHRRAESVQGIEVILKEGEAVNKAVGEQHER